MKICTKCGQSKPLTDFHKNKSKPDGLKSQCKACTTKEYAKAKAIAEGQRVVLSEAAKIAMSVPWVVSRHSGQHW